jgi:hypothetical protein
VVGVGEHPLDRQPHLVEAPGAGERLDVLDGGQADRWLVWLCS